MCDITDHCPTFLRIPIITNNYLNAKTKISFRLVNAANKDKFSHMLRNLNLDSVRDRNINIFTDALISRINEIYCTCFPLKIKYISNKQINNPWVDRSILNLIKKSQYFKLLRLGIITVEENNYFKNRVNSLISKAKKNYYSSQFEINKNNIRKTWSLIKNIISPNSSKKGSISKIIHNNAEYYNHKDIAEIFNNYFCEIPLELNNNLPSNNIDPLKFMKTNRQASLFLNPVSNKECSKFINSLKFTKQDKNAISVKLLKENHEVIAPMLCELINLSFSTGLFPNCLKCSIITPIFKNGDHNLVSNFRPISILPIISKIFEKCLYVRLYDFVCKFNVITPIQFGFLRGKSTEGAITLLTEFLYNSLNDRNINLSVFVDLRKAFDTVHQRWAAINFPEVR